MLKDVQRTIITLSGIVGAGKSTAAKSIVQSLRAAGYAAEHIRFQDFADWRGRRRTEAPAEREPRQDARGQSPVAERWTGYRRRRLSAPIVAGYTLRTMLFRWRLRRWPRDTVLVFDRYFYDSLVHFELGDGSAALRLLMRAIPAPTVAALLVVRDKTIEQRRSQYSPDYVRQVAAGYDALPGRVPGLLVVRTDDFASVGEAANRIVSAAIGSIKQRTDR